jgi:hypothetical protein
MASLRSWLVVAVLVVGCVELTGSSRGGDGFRAGGQLPRGYEEVDLANFRKSLLELWGKLTQRDPGELAGRLALALGAQQLSRYAQVHGSRMWSHGPCLPPELRPMVNRIDTASALIQLGYDPAKGSQIMGTGPLQNFKVVQANWEAGVFRPAYAVLQNIIKQSRFWVVVRGTYSVEDIMTDLAAEPEKFMDGHVHKGVLRSAAFIAQELRECIKKHAPVSRGKNAKLEIMLVGHSLGGAAAAVATAMLQIEHYDTKAIVFGAPSCIYRATYLENMLARHVTHLVLDADVVPRLNNETVAKLLSPQERSGSEFITAAKSFIFDSLRTAVKDNRPLARVLGLEAEGTPCSQCPPGRLYLVQQRPEGESRGDDARQKWWILPAACRDFSNIILSPRMLSDHNVKSYIDAVQDAYFRYLPDCSTSSSSREL